MKKILITGSNGFIGSNLIHFLKDEHEIFGLNRKSSVHLDNKHSFVCDIRDYNKVHDIFRTIHPDILIHLAAIVHKNNTDTSVDNYNFINYECAINLFNECRLFQTKIIFASTTEVFGDIAKKIVTEETECNPISYYAKAKYGAEEYLRCNDDIQYSILRFAAVYGKKHTFNIDKRVFFKKEKIAYFFKKGTYSFSFCSVFNICEFIQFLIQKETQNDVYIVSDNKAISVKDIIELYKQYTNLKYVLHLPYHLCNISIFIIEKILSLFKKKDLFFSKRNFNKLFKSTIYINKKASLLYAFKWDLKNTLFGEET